MKSNNRMKKYSFIVSLVLVLSLALSPVSAFADELDTPVHEDPIDEIQQDTVWINRHFSLNAVGSNGAPGVSVVFDASACCDCSWTEGISGQFNTVTISLTNIIVAGNNSFVIDSLEPQITSYNLGEKAMEYFWLYYTSAYKITVIVNVYCNEYAELTMNAYAYETPVISD